MMVVGLKKFLPNHTFSSAAAFFTQLLHMKRLQAAMWPFCIAYCWVGGARYTSYA